MVLDIQQTWWHIEEIYYPHPARKFRSVMDIFTDENVMPLELLKDTGFVGLKIVARNAQNRELASLDYHVNGSQSLSSSIIANLSPLGGFPDIPKCFQKKYNDVEKLSSELLKHVRLEIEYVIQDVETEEIKEYPIIDWFIPKKEANCVFLGEMQPEFYITLPEGWVISGDSVFKPFIDNHFVKSLHNYIRRRIFDNKISVGNHFEGKVVGLCVRARDDVENPISGTMLELKLNKPYVKMNDDGKRTYHYLIKGESYRKLRDWIKTQKNAKADFLPRFGFIFQTEPSIKMIGISLCQYIFVIPAIFISADAVWSLLNHSSTYINNNVAIASLIALLSFTYFYEKHDVPHKLIFIPIFIFSIFAIILNFVTSLSHFSV